MILLSELQKFLNVILSYFIKFVDQQSQLFAVEIIKNYIILCIMQVNIMLYMVLNSEARFIFQIMFPIVCKKKKKKKRRVGCEDIEI